MEDMQKEIETKEFEASVGGGAVVVKINGKNTYYRNKKFRKNKRI